MRRHETKKILTLVLLGALAVPFAVLASSHAEAPVVADDPAMDGTDVWAWKDSASTVTILAAWNGLSTPAAGPSYKKWVAYPHGLYEIHIDTNGDGVEDLTYQFRFSNVDNGASTALRASSPGSYGALSSAGDSLQKLRQTYTIAKISGSRRSAPSQVSGSLPVAPPSTGPRLTRGRLGAFNASIAGTATVTNGATTVTGTGTAFSTALTAGQVIAFANQAGATYVVAAAPTATSFSITTAFTGPTNTATTVFTRGSASPTAGNDYESIIASSAIFSNVFGGGTERVFVGPRADAFFADQGASSDRLKVRTFGTTPPAGAPAIGSPAPAPMPDLGQYGGGHNAFAGKNVEVIALQIPISSLGGSFSLPFGGQYVGVWSSSSRAKLRVLPRSGATGTGTDNRDLASGSFVQVSRVGNPFANELFIPYDKKDAWNGDVPSRDVARWAQYFSSPELGGLLSAVYGLTVPSSPRNDLQVLFAPDTLKVRVDLATPLTASDPAFLGNGQGFFLGRTLADDVVDLVRKLVAGQLVEDPSLGGYGVASIYNMPTFFPLTFNGSTMTRNNVLGDGVDYGTSGSACGLTITPSTFPYMQTPWDGQELGNDYVQSPRHP